MITNAGLAGMASRLNGDGAEAAFTYLALGTGSTAAAATDTTLETEITDTGLERSAATADRATTTVTDDTATLAKTWTATGVKILREVGVLNADTAGTLLSRSVFDAVTTADGDSFTVTFSGVITT